MQILSQQQIPVLFILILKLLEREEILLNYKKAFVII